jgi:glucosamine 6-phosphate synthetase-like amidotransferase/phosphosugar isomerase protein
LIEKNKAFGGLTANLYIQLLSYYLSIEKGFNPDISLLQVNVHFAQFFPFNLFLAK